MNFLFINFLVFITFYGMFDAVHTLSIGQSCALRSGERGTCKYIRDCPQASLQMRGRLSSCGNPFFNIYCCPSRISEKKCKEYEKQRRQMSVALGSLTFDSEPEFFEEAECDLSNGLVTGGKEAQENEFPHAAALGFLNQETNELSFKCGGNLISEKFVLTVAHCNGAHLVRLGTHDVSDTSKGRDYEIANFIKHPQYDQRDKLNDIALIELKETVQFSESIQPACLWQKTDINVTRAIVVGWGYTEYLGETSDILMKAALEFTSKKTCEHSILNNRIQLRDTQICAGGVGDKDTCGGDSGGPLEVVSDQCTHHIIGLTSYGSTYCGLQTPGVYTRVGSYLDWIEGIVWPQ